MEEVGSRAAVPDLGIAGPTIAAEWHDVDIATAPGIPIGYVPSPVATRCQVIQHPGKPYANWPDYRQG